MSIRRQWKCVLLSVFARARVFVCVCRCWAELSSAVWPDSLVDLQWNLQRHVYCWQLLYTLCFQRHWRLNAPAQTSRTHIHIHSHTTSAFLSLTVSLWSPCIFVDWRWWGVLGSRGEREMIQSGDVLVAATENTWCKRWLGWEGWKNCFNMGGFFCIFTQAAITTFTLTKLFMYNVRVF